MSAATGPMRGSSRRLTSRRRASSRGLLYPAPVPSSVVAPVARQGNLVRLRLAFIEKGTFATLGAGGVPDLNLRDRMNLPDGRSPVPDVLDVLIVVQGPPRDADSHLTLAKIEERLIGPAGLRGLERGVTSVTICWFRDPAAPHLGC